MEDKTFAYAYGHSAEFTAVHLDISTEERKDAVLKALKNIIDNVYGGKRDGVQPYKNLFEQIKPETEFIHASQGHLSCLEYALSNAQEDVELCASMLDRIRQADKNLTPVVNIKGYECIPRDTWEEHGVNYSIGQSVDYWSLSFYYACATDGTVAQYYEYDHEPSRERVMSDHAENTKNILHFGRLGNGITVYDISKTDLRTRDYLYVAHISDEGIIKYIINQKKLNAEDISLIERQAERQKAKFTGYWNKLPIESRYERILDVALELPREKMKAFSDDNLTMEEKVKKYEHSLIFCDEYFPAKVPSLIKVETAPQTRGGSHITTTADLSAKRVESRGNMAENNTTFEVSSMTEIYDKPLDYAKENGEIDKWRDSMHETQRCVKEIEKLISDNHDGYFLKTDKIIDSAVGEFGTECVALALAATIQNKPWDGRFSKANKDWANSFSISQDALDRLNINSHSVLIDGVACDYRKFLLTLEKNLTENKSAEHTQGGITMAENNTTFEVSSMTQLENGGNVKALANVVINKEIAVNGVKVMEGEKGLYISMPSKKIGGEYVDTAHPITEKAYEQLSNAVLGDYDKLVASGEKTLKNDLGTDKTKPVASTLEVSLHNVSGVPNVAAAGQVNIDDCFVIKDIKVIKTEGKPEFAIMPAYQNQNGKYVDIANPITTAMYNKMQEAVIGKYNALEKVEYKGVKFAELGDKSEVVSLPKQNNKYAEKLMNELDKAGVKYQARIGNTTTISVNAADKPKLESVNKQLKAALNPEQPKQENKPSKHSKR